MTADELKTRLLEARSSPAAATAETWEMAQVMLEPLVIGHPDPELRDQLVYTTLCDWIMSGVLRPDQLRAVTTTVMDDMHLFYRLGARRRSGRRNAHTRQGVAVRVL